MSQQKIKIVFVSATLSRGGAERVTSTLLANLDRSRFKPSLCLLRENITYPLGRDVDVTILNRSAGGAASDMPLGKLAKRKPWMIPVTIHRLRSYLTNTQPDIVVSNIDEVNCVTGTALNTSNISTRWIARVGSNPSAQPKWLNWWRRSSYSQADLVVTNSHRMSRAFAAAFPACKGRVETLGNPTDFDRIDALAGEAAIRRRDFATPLLVAVGRISHEKRYDLLIESVARLRETLPVRLWICGDGPLRARVERQVADRGLSDSVEIFGFLDNPYALMQQADVFVLTSDHEGLPNALIEAQGLGLPAVSTNCDYGPDEIIEHGRTGILVEHNRPQQLAGALASLLTDAACRQEMGKAAKSRARRLFGLRPQIERWEAMLTAVAFSRQAAGVSGINADHVLVGKVEGT